MSTAIGGLRYTTYAAAPTGLASESHGLPLRDRFWTSLEICAVVRSQFLNVPGACVYLVNGRFVCAYSFWRAHRSLGSVAVFPIRWTAASGLARLARQ